MRGTYRLMPAAFALAGLLGAALAAPVAAGADGADYVTWRFLPSGPRGVGLMTDGASNTVMLAETVGLKPNATYRYVGSTALCGSAHQAANAVWTKTFKANGKGAAFTNTTFDDSTLTNGLKSVRLFQGTSQVDCAKAMPYPNGGGGPADAIARLSPYGTQLMVYVDLGSGNDKLTAVGHGFIASHGYRLVGASVACPAQPTAATTLFTRTGQTNSLGILWRQDKGSNLTNETPKSIQLFNPSSRVACVTPTRLTP